MWLVLNFCCRLLVVVFWSLCSACVLCWRPRFSCVLFPFSPLTLHPRLFAMTARFRSRNRWDRNWRVVRWRSQEDLADAERDVRLKSLVDEMPEFGQDVLGMLVLAWSALPSVLYNRTVAYTSVAEEKLQWSRWESWSGGRWPWPFGHGVTSSLSGEATTSRFWSGAGHLRSWVRAESTMIKTGIAPTLCWPVTGLRELECEGMLCAHIAGSWHHCLRPCRSSGCVRAQQLQLATWIWMGWFRSFRFASYFCNNVNVNTRNGGGSGVMNDQEVVVSCGSAL